ncbi:hypothetical protein MuYL_4224 [Mucilaginibacter xinganensis]|uniref:Uncharacterized protein n=1 Tax=Mucilaginibacter xinganensis TaxID=1234841 RepID=A0A223P1S5_9SPHI|nr:hypothetical protein MuYL_4224 [Mucilaginibacter xinganensis]
MRIKYGINASRIKLSFAEMCGEILTMTDLRNQGLILSITDGYMIKKTDG